MFVWTLTVCVLLTAATYSGQSLRSELGMRHEKGEVAADPPEKRRPSESDHERQMVTIDLSALRPSLPGLVLYKYGDLAPKLVQVDLASLNPQLQPHVIWPQFDQLELSEDRVPYDVDSVDSIPYLTETESLMSPRHQRFSRRPSEVEAGAESGWSEMGDIADGDVYDFIPDSVRNEELMTLQRSLPLADEVIVPLDWEEERPDAASKRNVFVSKGWKAGGQKEHEAERMSEDKLYKFSKGRNYQDNARYTPFGLASWRPGKRKHQRARETESEGISHEESGHDLKRNPGKKDVFVSKGWGPGGRALSTGGGSRGPTASRRVQSMRGMHGRNSDSQSARISGQESWAVPRRYWNVPHLFGAHFQ